MTEENVMGSSTPDTDERIGTRVQITSGIVAGVAGLMVFLLPSWKDVAALVMIGSIVPFILYFVKSHTEKQRKYKAANTPEPLTDLDKDQYISRIDLVKQLQDALAGEDDLVLVVTGRSGVGKSTAVKEILEAECDSKEDYHVFSVYPPSVKYAIKEAIDKNLPFKEILSGLKRKEVFVFDQFERLFQTEDISGRTESIEVFQEFFRQVDGRKTSGTQKGSQRRPSLKIIIVIREEFLLNLFAFMDSLHWNTTMLAVYGFSKEGWGGDMQRDLEQHLRDAGAGEELASSILKELNNPDNRVVRITKDRKVELDHTAKPVEAAIALKTLRLLNPEKEQISPRHYKHLEGINSIVTLYFKRFLEASVNMQSSARVLYALSVDPQSTRRLTVAQICQITNLDLTEVNETVEYFTHERRALLKKIPERDAVCIDWAHEYLAEKFNEISGTIKSLTPEDRDNISFFWRRRNKMEERDSPDRFRKLEVDKMRMVWGKLWLVTSMLILTLRLFGPLTGWENWPSPFNGKISPGIEHVDVPFLFVALALAGWALYIFRIHNRLLLSIRGEKLGGNLLSWLLSPISCGCVLLTSCYPEHWLSFTGIGGLAVGLKYLQLARTRGKKFDWLPFSKLGGWYFKAGTQTCINSFIVGLVGLAFAGLFDPEPLVKFRLPVHMYFFSLSIWLITIWFAYYISIWQHTSSAVIPTLRGEFVRNQFRD